MAAALIQLWTGVSDRTGATFEISSNMYGWASMSSRTYPRDLFLSSTKTCLFVMPLAPRPFA